MKKTILLIMMTALTILSVSAQGKLALTPRAGLNLATITSTKGSSLKPGLNFGITVDYLFSSQLGVESGLVYSMQGTTFSALSPGLDYLHIPLLAKYYLTDYYTESRGFYIVAGPQLGLIAVMDKVGYPTDYEGKLMPDAITKELDFAAVLGVGYELQSGLALSAQFNLGLANIAQDSFRAYTTTSQATSEQVIKRDKSYKNFVFQLNFGYRFTL